MISEDSDGMNRETLLSKMVLDPIGAFLAISDVFAKAGEEIADITAQRDDLLATCEGLCHAIKYLGKSRCASHYAAFVYEDGQEDNGIEYVETHWKLHPAICLMDAYEMGQAAIEKAKGV